MDIFFLIPYFFLFQLLLFQALQYNDMPRQPCQKYIAGDLAIVLFEAYIQQYVLAPHLLFYILPSQNPVLQNPQISEKLTNLIHGHQARQHYDAPAAHLP